MRTTARRSRKRLRNDGFVLAICSNKPQHLCEKVIADVGLADYFAVIVGSAPGRLAKPAPDLMQLVLTRLCTSVRNCLYVGDSEIDAALSEAIGVRFALVTYGYATDQLDAGQHNNFSRFSDLVQWVTTGQAAILPMGDVA